MASKKPDIEKISLRMENIWTSAESRIIQDIVRRIRKNGMITSTADYQITRMAELGRSSEEIEHRSDEHTSELPSHSDISRLPSSA